MLQLDDNEPRQAQPDEGLALAGPADRAEQVVGVNAGARNGRVSDPARQLAADAAGRDRHRQPTLGVARDGADRVRAWQPLLSLAVVDEDRRIGQLDPVVASEA